MTQPTLDEETEANPSRLSRETAERKGVEELVADAAHGHITLERMKSLGAEFAREHQGLEAELSGAKERLHAQQSEAERRKHLEALRDRLVQDWEGIAFETLQSGLRDVIDRIEVDGEELRVYLRV